MARSQTFLVRWFEPAGAEVREERIEIAAGERPEQALAKLRPGGVLLSSAAMREARTPRRGTRFDVAWWCRELRTLLVAGMTVVEALETLAAQTRGHAGATASEHVLALLREGRALSVALQDSGAFPPVLVAGVRASERTSALVDALDDYLRYDGLVEKLRRELVSAAIYPSLVVGLGGLISAFLLLYVVPRFSRMYAELRGPVSGVTRVLIETSRFVASHGPEIAAGAVALAILAVAAWRGGLVSRGLSAAVERIGPLQAQLDEYRRAKLYQSLALMFRGGYPLDDALSQCAGLELGERIGTGLATARSALARGARVSSALQDAGLTDDVSLRLLAVGERTGNFDRVLQTIAERHAGRFATFIERATRIVEPVLLMGVALLVGSIVVMMYMPVFDIASSLG